MMKRMLHALLAVVCSILFLSGTASAAGQTYALDELDAEVTVPEGDHYILYRGMDPDDPILDELGLTASQVDQILADEHSYLEVMDHSLFYEFTIKMMTDEDYETIFDYALLSRDGRDEVCQGSREWLEKQGYTVHQIEWYESGQVLFLFGYMDCPKDSGAEWLCQYQTLHNGKMISLNAVSPHLKGPTQEIKDQLKEMADGFRFTYDAPVPQEALDFHKDLRGGIDWLEVLAHAAVGGVTCGAAAAAYSWLSKRNR